MTLETVRPVIEAPIRTPYRFGLFSVLDIRADLNAGLGFSWESIGCDTPALEWAQSGCVVAGAADTHTKEDLLADCVVSSVNPFTVIAYDTSSLGRPPREVGGVPQRAIDRLRLFEQHTVETVISTWMEAGADDVSAPAPAGADYGMAVKFAIGEVEAALADLGGEGVILVRRSTLALLPEYFTATGSVMRTLLGTPVAALGGWGPEERDVVLGAVSLVGARGAEATGRGYNTSINDHADYAERDYSIGWDCTAVSAQPSVAT